MAAGMGSRYGGLKQLEPFGPNGETLLEYSIYDAKQAGFDRCVFIIRKDIESAFKEQLVKCFAHQIDCDFVFQDLDDLPQGSRQNGQVAAKRQKPWGTGHAVWATRCKVSGPFAVINADDFYGRSGFVALAKFLNHIQKGECLQTHHALIGYRLSNTLSKHGKVARGLCQTSSDGRLISVEEHTGIEITDSGIVSRNSDAKQMLRGDAIVSMNFWGFNVSFFDCLEQHFIRFLEQNRDDPNAEFYLPFVVDSELAAANAQVDVLTSDAQWFGVTYPQDKEYVQQQIDTLIAEKIYPKCLWHS